MKFLTGFLFITGITLFTRVDSVRNGEFISIKEAPFFVTLIFRNNDDDSKFYPYCGASILSEQWILTAAHCIDYENFDRKFIFSGGSNYVDVEHNIHLVEKVFVHGDWNNDINDIALIKLKLPLQFNEYQQPIKLHSGRPETANTITVYGVGYQGNARNEAPVLKKTEVQYVNQSFCRNVYDASQVPDSSFCADASVFDACAGDSGGPAVIDGELAGIIVAGGNCITMNRADDDPMPPGVYVRIHYFYDWILKITGLQL